MRPPGKGGEARAEEGMGRRKGEGGKGMGRKKPPKCSLSKNMTLGGSNYLNNNVPGSI